MADLISIPIKKSSDVDIVKPLKNLIQSTYSTADKPEDYSDAINELNKLRNNAIWKAFEKYESSLDFIYSYHDELTALEGKIPANEIQIPFKWKDAFDKGSLFGGRMSLTISSLSYERVCILYNIAALQSAVASSQSVDSDEGLKLAAKLYQQSAGIFNHLKGTVMAAIQQDPTPDLNPETLGALSSLMLAQAQEIFVMKAIHDNMKEAIVAKLSNQCEELYAEVLKIFQRESLRQLWDRDWLPLIAGKQGAYHAMSEYYQSLVCKANKSVGEEISRLEHAVELFKVSQQRSGRPTFFQDFLAKAQRNLTEAKKDNDFIYHERIPDVKTLEPIGRALVAKMLPLPDKFGSSFKDLFAELVPVAVHQALAAYDVRKNEIVNTEIMKLRESTQFLNSVLASLNLPAAIEVTEGGELPQSLLDKAGVVRNSGGIGALQNLLSELPHALQRNKDILDEADRLIREEKESDDALRTQFKERWTRTPSEKLTDMFRSNSEKYRVIINNAIQADKVVRDKFETHREGIELLSKSPEELNASVPKGSGGSVADTSAVNKLRKLMEEVEKLKAERDAIESDLKSATLDMKSKFLSALAQDGAISEPNLSVEALGRVFGPLQKQVKESIEKQEKLVADIQNANTEFVQESGAGANSRDTKMRELASAHDTFTELQSNLKEGTQFYNNLTELLISFQNKISDFCFARKTEKEELLKDLTSEISRQAVNPTPNPPSHHTTDGGVKTPPERPPAPVTTSAPPANLPYPVYSQSMPLPYGATSATPYPTYVSPPMPQGYNPYGTMPYPASYNYPGGFPQAPPPSAYPGYPQQGPPGGYPQQGVPGGYPQQGAPGGYPQQGAPGTYPPPGSGYPQQHPPGW